MDAQEQWEAGDIAGLALLDVATTLAAHKTARQRQARWLPGGQSLAGYEIHHGRTQAGPLAVPHLDEGLGWQQGAVTGVYLHGLLENTAYRQWWLEALGWRGQAQDWQARLEAELDRVASEVSACWPGM